MGDYDDLISDWVVNEFHMIEFENIWPTSGNLATTNT